jgi:hypothetical protein
MRVIAFLFSLCFFVSPAFAIDVAPRISDREIIESLAELREGQRGLQQQIADLRAYTDKRFDALERSISQQFDALQIQISDLRTTFQATLWLFISITLVILSAMAKILWEHQRQLTVLHAVLETQKDRFPVPKRSD